MQQCVNTTAGTRVVTTGPAVVYREACAASGAAGYTLRRCEQFQYQGIKQAGACPDGLCYRKVTAGGVTGWILNSGVSTVPAAACASGESATVVAMAV